MVPKWTTDSHFNEGFGESSILPLLLENRRTGHSGRWHTPRPVHTDPKRPAWLWAPSSGAAPSVCGRWTPSLWRPPHWPSPSTPSSAGCWSAASCLAFSDTPRLCMGLRPCHPPKCNRESSLSEGSAAGTWLPSNHLSLYIFLKRRHKTSPKN